MKIIKLYRVDSTNEYCKRLNRENAVVCATRQTAGKGTKGRSFSSEKGGLYVSVMRTETCFDPARAFAIMINACVAVCKTVESFSLKPTVKWANDVLVGGRKICGTLIENTVLSGGKFRSIVGMGINVTNRLPDELNEVATSIFKESGKRFSVRAVREKLLKFLSQSYTVEDYKSYIDWFGKTVTLTTAQGDVKAVAIDVADDGRLVCLIDGKTEYISSAEVSLRF